MRITGEFDIAGIKVTVFRMNERTSVKFEYNLLEQTYKFRDGSGVHSTEDVKKICTEAFIKSLTEVFDAMAKARNESLASLQTTDGLSFDEII